MPSSNYYKLVASLKKLNTETLQALRCALMSEQRICFGAWTWFEGEGGENREPVAGCLFGSIAWEETLSQTDFSKRNWKQTFQGTLMIAMSKIIDSNMIDGTDMVDTVITYYDLWAGENQFDEEQGYLPDRKRDVLVRVITSILTKRDVALLPCKVAEAVAYFPVPATTKEEFDNQVKVW